jgi:hypothetical protein
VRRWALLVVVLYGLGLVVFTGPVLMAAFLPEMKHKEALAVYGWWPYWLVVCGLMLLQGGLLLVPARVAAGRPVGRRALWVPTLTTGLLAGLLVTGLLFSVYEAVFDSKQLAGKGEGPVFGVLLAGLPLLAWVAWAAVFRRLGGDLPPEDLVARQCALLMKGSIAEHIIAVATHVFVRHRDNCCAGFLTFVGLCTGLAVMAMAFGPAVFLLFVRRWQLKQARQVGPGP